MTTNLTIKVMLLSVASVLQKLSGFLLIIFLVRLVDKVEYGTYQQVFYIGTIVYGLFVSGLSSSLYYFVPRLRLDSEKGNFVKQTLFLTTSLGLVSGIVIFFSATLLSAILNNTILADYLKYYSIYVVFWIGSDYFLHFLNSYNKYVHSMIYAAIESLLNMLAILVPLIFFNDLLFSFMTLAVVGILRYLVYLSVSFMYIGINTEIVIETIKKQVKYSFPLMLSGWADLVGGYIDKIIVSIFYSPAILAIYAIGTIKIPIWDILVKPVNIVLRVKFAELLENNDHVKIRQIWREAIRKQSIIILPIIFFLWVISGLLFPIIFTTQYTESVTIFRIYMLDKFLMVASFSVFPLCMGRPDFLFKGSIVFAVANCLLALVFIYPLGIYGPIVALVISQYIHAGFYIYIINKHLGISPKTLLPPDIIIKSLVANLIPSLIVLLMLQYLENNIMLILYSILVYGVVYLTTIKMFNLVYDTELQYVLKLLKFKKPA